MPAPDLSPPPPFETPERALHVHLHAKLVMPQELAGGVVVVIDNLRASVTMTAALFSGAAEVVPVLTVEDAVRMREANGDPAPGVVRDEPSLARRALMGGERGGVLIPGFDLDNSPRAYTRERVQGRTIIFTTVNGTAALLQSRLAARVLVGSFANLSAVCASVANDPRPVHLLCCGTREEISLDDVLPAGAMAQRLIAQGRNHTSDDSARLAIAAYEGIATGGLLAAMRASRGGRNLERVGLGPDVEFCSRIDTMPVVPEFDGRRVVLSLAQ
ncbi:MAG: 2-phosphosulfolactate phosphatase [Planctomycetota bacterium]